MKYLKVFKGFVSGFIRPNSFNNDFWRLNNEGSSCGQKFVLYFRFGLWRVLQFMVSLIRVPQLIYVAILIILERDRLWFRPLKKTKRGEGCVVDTSVWIMNGRNIELANNVKVSAGSALLAGDKACIYIADDVLIGPNSLIVAMNHGFRSQLIPKRLQPWVDDESMTIRIGKDVWIGGGVIVLPGSDIGDGAVIAAGSIVRGKIEPYSIYRQSRTIVSSKIFILD